MQKLIKRISVAYCEESLCCWDASDQGRRRNLPALLLYPHLHCNRGTLRAAAMKYRGKRLVLVSSQVLPAHSLGGQWPRRAALERCLSFSPGVATCDQEQVTGLLKPVEMA